MGALARGTLPEKRRGRNTLSVRDPQIERILGGLAIEAQDIASVRLFGNQLLASVRRFNAGREVIQGNRRISKREAESIWRQQVVRKPNALAARWNGGQA
ncbi:hypothetical protein GCM10023208_08110 [Erythrobacter westpacificensis]|uniref:Uncharacterized protein n=1 Tax=Erythrobacter westpacificensis TaxID=1055231 RepID=A0ABP9K239_9SPHN